jgi:hypothetical protein
MKRQFCGWGMGMLVAGAMGLGMPHEASAQGFSANAIGYLEVGLSAGSNFIAVPLAPRNSSISNLLPSLPVGSFYQSWDVAERRHGPTNFFTASGWSNPSEVLLRPNGGKLWLPSATQVSFVGELQQTPLMPQARAAGRHLLSAIPYSGLDGAEPPDGTIMHQWNRATQEFENYIYFAALLGWFSEDFDEVTPELAPGESAFFDVPSSFSVPNYTSVSSPAPRPVTLQNSRLENGNLKFTFLNSAGSNFYVLRATSLAKNEPWLVVGQGEAGHTSPTVTVSNVTQAGFVRIIPVINLGSPLLLDGSRANNRFTLSFYAPSNGVYEVQRSPSASGGSWQLLHSAFRPGRSIATFTDSNAVAPQNYYRVRMLP